MQREIEILEMSLNKGNGGLTIAESREAANALDKVVQTLNEVFTENDQLKKKVEALEKKDKKPVKKA